MRASISHITAYFDLLFLHHTLLADKAGKTKGLNPKLRLFIGMMRLRSQAHLLGHPWERSIDVDQLDAYVLNEQQEDCPAP